MIENPPWVNTLLTENWAELEASMDPALLPVTTVSRRGKRALAEDAEYGCGHYGCVMATSTPGIVCKVTSDPSEAAFVELAWKRLGRTREKGWPEGIVQYHQIIQLSGSRRGRPTWMLWRDEAWAVGNIRYIGLRDEYEDRALRDGMHRLNEFKIHAGRVQYILSRGKPGLLEKAMRLFSDYYWNEGAWEIAYPTSEIALIQTRYRLESLKSYHRIAAELRICTQIAELWAQEPGLTEIGDALQQFLDHGILLADVHGDNIGRPSPHWRTDVRGTWIITDPGHMVQLW